MMNGVYPNGGPMNEQRLCLDGDMAEPFMKHKVGDKVTLTVDAVLVGAELRQDYENSAPQPEGKSKPKEPKKKPHVEFVIAAVDGAEAAADGVDEDTTDEEMEEKISKAKGY